MTLIEDLVTTTTDVKQTTLQAYPEHQTEKYVCGFNEWLHHSIAPSPPIWNTAMFEASSLAVASYFLASHGFYEEANAILREILDGFLNRLCWDSLNDQRQQIHPLEIKEGKNTMNYWDWESGRTEKYISTEKIWNILLTNSRIRAYQDLYNIKGEVKDLLSLLNKYVHGRPESRHKPGKSRASLINAQFNPNDFGDWIFRLKALYGYVSTLSILSYPDLLKMKVIENFASLDPAAIERITKAIS